MSPDSLDFAGVLFLLRNSPKMKGVRTHFAGLLQCALQGACTDPCTGPCDGCLHVLVLTLLDDVHGEDQYRQAAITQSACLQLLVCK